MAANTFHQPISIAEAIYRIQYSLIELPSCSASQFLIAGSLLSHSDYQDVIVERSIVGLCGFPLCHTTLPVDRDRRGRFRVSLRVHRVYDLEETYKYCSEACVVRSREFLESLSLERVFDTSQAQIQQVLRLFEDHNIGDDELEGEGDFGMTNLSIKEKEDTGAGEVSLDEWIGPSNAIEGYVPLRYRIGDSGQDISEGIAKQLENVILGEKKTREKADISKSSKCKHHKKLEAATNEIVLSKEINGQLVDVYFGRESVKNAVNISNYGNFLKMNASSNECIVEELEDKISSEKKTISEKKLLKSCLMNSGSRVGNHSVRWADEKNNASLDDNITIPQESYEGQLDSSIRFASAEACAAALTQVAKSVTSGKAEVEDAVSEAGILILPQLQSLQGIRKEDEDIFKFDQGIVKWPKKTVLLDTDMFEVVDSWHDAPPESFSLNLSPFATMWMALFGWITCSSLAYIYGHDERSYKNFVLVNGKEYPRKVTMSDGQSLEIRQTLDGFICWILPAVVKYLRLQVSVSTLEKFMVCTL